MKHVFVGFLPWLIPWNLYTNQSVSICFHDIFKKRLRAVTSVWTPHPTSRSRKAAGKSAVEAKKGIRAKISWETWDLRQLFCWWFGTWLLWLSILGFYFPYIGNKMNNWRTPSFFRGVETTNQELVLICRCQNGMCFSDFFSHKAHKALGIGTGMKQHETTNRLSSG